MKDDKLNTFIITEWKVIQERFMKVDDNMKLNINEHLRKTAYLKTTYLKPPSEPVKTNGSPKKVKPTENEYSKRQSTSYFEHVNSHFQDSSTPTSKQIVYKGAHIRKPCLPPSLPKIIHIEKMSFFYAQIHRADCRC